MVDNDIRCDGTDDEHIPVFGSQVRAALEVITTSSPHSKILIVGQEDRPAGNLKALTTPSLIAAATGTGMCAFFNPAGKVMPGQIAKLTTIIQGYEAEQAKQCSRFPQCFTDNGVLATFVDDPHDFADPNGNHLNVHGLSRVAALIWPRVTKILE